MFLDAEGGTRAISHREDIDVLSVNSWRKIQDVHNELKRGGHGYKTIVYDNLSEYAVLCIQGIAGIADQPEIQEWGKSNRAILNLVREGRDMARFQDINVVFIAWDVQDKDEMGRPLLNAAFTPGIQKELPGIVDTIGHISVADQKSGLRLLSFNPGPRTIAKFRRSQDEAALKIPFEIYYGLDNMPMPDILRVIKEGGDWPANKYPAPRQQHPAQGA